ncbi:MAG: hypothetical protein HYS55_06645 [Candidatus Omnitrophica bacterium]|nr:hypothetical protein [Candidatus Omnitrophota bacterium]
MDVDFAFLADAAEVANGKLHLVGGAFDTIWTRSTPLRYPKVSFAMRLLLSAAELDRKHRVEIKIMHEDGKVIPPSIGGELEIKRNPNLPKGWKQGFLSVMNFVDLTFPVFGDYSFELLVNNTSVKSIPLRIAQAVNFQT